MALSIAYQYGLAGALYGALVVFVLYPTIWPYPADVALTETPENQDSNRDSPVVAVTEKISIVKESGSGPERGRYAIATLTLTPDYAIGSHVWCKSIRRHGPLPPDVDIVAYVPSDAQQRGIDLGLLSHCFSRVLPLDPVRVSVEPSFFRFKEQYVKLRFWAQVEYERLVYMDSDFMVMRLDPILDVLRSPAFGTLSGFGAVKDFQANEFQSWWNGGFLVLKPSQSLFEELMSHVEQFIQQRRFDTEKAEQGYVSAYFENMGFTLPTVFNLNLAILYQRPEVWAQYVDRAVAIHFTLEKPWAGDVSRPNEFPFTLWRQIRDE